MKMIDAATEPVENEVDEVETDVVNEKVGEAENAESQDQATEEMAEAETAEETAEAEEEGIDEESTEVEPEGKRKRQVQELAMYREVCRSMIAIRRDIDSVEEQIDEQKSIVKRLSDRQKTLTELYKSKSIDLQDIEAGRFQLSLVPEDGIENNQPKKKPLDPAFECSISCLGLSEKEIELLESADIKMISDLEKQMRENAWWHKDIKGFGKAKVDKLTDALMDWRMRNPVPCDEEDDLDDNETEEVAAVDSVEMDAEDEPETEEATDDPDDNEEEPVSDPFFDNDEKDDEESVFIDEELEEELGIDHE